MTLLKNILNTVASKKSFFIPAGMTVTGNFTVDVPGQIAGTVNGDVIVNGRLLILKNAFINGNVKAHQLEIFGKVTGDIACSGKMVLQNESYIRGNISTVEIHLEKDAVVDGMITKPGLHSIIEELAADIEEELPLNPAPESPEPEVAPVIIKADDEEMQSWF